MSKALLIRFTARSAIALMFLSFLMQETHELAHTAVGRLICGCWGKRNFNLWTLCKGCSSENSFAILATIAGPVYSFSMIWIGYYLLQKASVQSKSIGLALIISTMPLSRVITPIAGGGDEVYALNSFWNNHALAWLVAVIIVFVLTIPPLAIVWRTIENRRKGLWFAGLIVVPFVATGIVVFGLLQGLLLENEVLSTYWILGSPKLVTIWFLCCLVIVLFTGRSLTTLLKPVSGKRAR